MDTCNIMFSPQEVHEWREVSIQAVCDNNNRPYGLASFTFTVTSTDDFWFGHETLPVTVGFTFGGSKYLRYSMFWMNKYSTIRVIAFLKKL